jgi:hypothetical protein
MRQDHETAPWTGGQAGATGDDAAGRQRGRIKGVTSANDAESHRIGGICATT